MHHARHTRGIDARAVVLGLVLVAPAAACSDTTANLRPAGYAHQVEKMDNAAVDADRGIRVIAQTEPWQGPVDVDKAVTPVRVFIANGRGEPVRIRYSDFVLIAADGDRLRAVPPHAIEGEAPLAGRIVHAPAFTWSGYAIAPHLVDVYPTLPAWDGPFARDLAYYEGGWYVRDQKVPLPTEDMLEHALPEGVLEPASSVEGFVYFEDVPRDTSSVELQIELAAATTGTDVATLRIPFAVD